MLIYKITLDYFDYHFVTYNNDESWGVDNVLTAYIQQYYKVNLHRPDKYEIDEIKNNIYVEEYKIGEVYPSI